MTIDNGIFEVKSTAGDTHLGGEDFDFAIKEYILLSYSEKNILKTKTLNDTDKETICKLFNIKNIEELKFKNNFTKLDNLDNNINKYIKNLEKFYELKNNAKSMRKLLTACESAKKTLSNTNIANINIDNFYDGQDLNVSLTRNTFEQICEDYFKRTST